MRKPTKKQQEKINEARISKATVNLEINIFRDLSDVYTLAEALISNGANDDELRAGIVAFLDGRNRKETA